MLNPGEAAILILRRSETEHDKHFVAVRRIQRSSFDRETKDFKIDGAQSAVLELGDTTDYQSELDQAIKAMKAI
jgi:hypothetical protein